MASVFASLGPRARRVLRYVGFVVLALVSFVFALQATFPYDRVKDMAIQQLSDRGYDLQIGDVERGIMPARVYFKAVTLHNRPAKASDVASTLYVEQAEIDAGLLSLLHGTASGRVDLKLGAGHLKGRASYGSDGLSLHVTGEDVPAASLPMRDLLGIPVSGKVQLAVNLDVPNEKSSDKSKAARAGLNWVKMEGNAELSCPSGCVIGDGKTKLKLSTNDVRQQEFLDQGGGGIDFGKVSLDSFATAAEVKNGKLDLTKFELKSPDGEAHIAFGLTLNQDFNSSSVTGCLRFHGSDALRKREPKTDAALSTTGGPLGPDGLFHIKLEGTLRRIFRRPLVCGQGSGTDAPGSPPPRPNLSVSPEPAKPPGLGSVGFPTPPPQVPPPSAQPAPTPPAPPAAQPPAAPPAQPAGDVVGQPPTVYPSAGSAGVPGAAPGSNPTAPAAPGAPQ